MIIYKKSNFYYASMYLEREKTGLTFNRQMYSKNEHVLERKKIWTILLNKYCI